LELVRGFELRVASADWGWCVMRKVVAGLVVAAAWLLGAQVAAAEVTFSPLAGSPFPTGAGPQSIASGGAVMATADAGANDVAVFDQGTEEHTGPFLAPAGRFGTGLAPASVAVNPTGLLVAVANRGDNTVSMFAVSGFYLGTRLTPVSGSPFATGVGPQSVAFSSDGRLLAVANRGDNTVSVFSVSSGGSLTPVPGSPFVTGGSPQSVAFDPPYATPGPGGEFLAVANGASNNVSMFSVSSGGSLTPVPGSPFATGRTPFDAQFGGTLSVPLLATANFTDNNVSVFSVSSSGALAPLVGSPLSLSGGSGPASLEFNPYGLLAVANSTSSTVSVFIEGESCNTEYNQGYNAGFNSGYNSGFKSEFRTAYRSHGSWQLGRKRGIQAARRSRHAAREAAQVARPAALTSSRPEAVPADPACDYAFNFAFNQAFNIGFGNGFNAAFNAAFRQGYKAGLAKGRRHR
jgi:6-phosphogluconolactonase (cycloisomerase 2 family)